MATTTTREISREELHRCDGKNGAPIYLAVGEVVYDASSNVGAYGPGGSYEVLAGHEVSFCLARSSLEPEDLDKDTGPLDADEQQRVQAFVGMFNKKYPIVGRLGVQEPRAVL